MTEAAQEFITPLTMQALSGNQVHTDLLDTKAEAAMGHIELAKWSDIILIAPCSANSIARSFVTGLLCCINTSCIIAVESSANTPVTPYTLVETKTFSIDPLVRAPLPSSNFDQFFAASARAW